MEKKRGQELYFFCRLSILSYLTFRSIHLNIMSLKIRKIVTWVITGLLALLMVAAGVGKFLSSGEGSNDTPNYFLVFSDAAWVPMLIGSLEAIAGLAIAFIPKLRVPAALCVMPLMLCALYAHLQVEGDFSNSAGAILALILSGLVIFLWRNYNLINAPSS